jgi:hypothetical protein
MQGSFVVMRGVDETVSFSGTIDLAELTVTMDPPEE